MAKLSSDDIQRIAEEVEKQEILSCKRVLEKMGIELPFLDEEDMSLYLVETDYY